MRLLRKITYGEFSEFIQEKKVHIDCRLLYKYIEEIASEILRGETVGGFGDGGCAW